MAANGREAWVQQAIQEIHDEKGSVAHPDGTSLSFSFWTREKSQQQQTHSEY